MRGLNLRRHFIPAFVAEPARGQGEERCRVEDLDLGDLVRPLELSATGDGESVSALFACDELRPIFREAKILEIPEQGLVFPASDVPIALIDAETARVVHAPWPKSWPRLVRADHPNPPMGDDRNKEARDSCGSTAVRAPEVDDYRFRDPVGAVDRLDRRPRRRAPSDGVASDVASLVDDLVDQLVTRLDQEKRLQVGPQVAVPPGQQVAATPAAGPARPPTPPAPVKKARRQEDRGQDRRQEDARQEGSGQEAGRPVRC